MRAIVEDRGEGKVERTDAALESLDAGVQIGDDHLKGGVFRRFLRPHKCAQVPYPAVIKTIAHRFLKGEKPLTIR